MRNNRTMISIIQIILIFMMVTGLKNHVIIIPALLDEAGRDAWITVIIVFFPTLIWGFLILYIYKSMKGEHIKDWLESVIGKRVTIFLLVLLGLHFLFIAAVTLKELVLWTNVSYLLKTPILVLIILFIIPSVLVALTNLRTIVIMNFYLLFFVVIFGFFIAFTNMPHKDFTLLRPMLEHGFDPVLKAAIYQGSGMSEMFILLVLQHRFQKKFNFFHFTVIAAILCWLTLGPLIGAIVEFGPAEASIQRYPAFEEWGLARIGIYIEHVDYLSIYQWLAGAIIRISLMIYLCIVLIRPKKKKSRKIIGISSGLLIFLLTIVPIDEHTFFILLKQFFLPLTFWVYFVSSILFGIFSIIKNRKERGKQRVQQA